MPLQEETPFRLTIVGKLNPRDEVRSVRAPPIWPSVGLLPGEAGARRTSASMEVIGQRLQAQVMLVRALHAGPPLHLGGGRGLGHDNGVVSLHLMRGQEPHGWRGLRMGRRREGSGTPGENESIAIGGCGYSRKKRAGCDLPP